MVAASDGLVRVYVGAGAFGGHVGLAWQIELQIAGSAMQDGYSTLAG